MIVSSFRKPRERRRGGKGAPPPAPYASIAGWNERPEAAKRDARSRRERMADRRKTRPPVPRPAPAENRPPRSRAERIRRLLLALFILFGVVPALLSVLAYWSAEIPDPSAVQTNQIATILAADGSTVIAKVVPPDGNRMPVPLSDVPQPVRDAVLSAEDRNFYTNPGYSTSGFLRAVRDNLLGKDNAGGGSTITQQYVKNAFLGSERTVTRKMRELIIAAKMARQWSKDDILAAYLNTIYYGRGSYGIAAAAKVYFDKQVNQLTLAEGAVLAALIRTPSILDPETHLAELKARWRYVLDGMVEMGVLAPGDRDATTFPLIIPLTQIPDDDVARGPEGLIRNQVVRELRDSGISERDLNKGALQITTTIDARAQQAVLGAVRDRLGAQPPELRAAVVSIDPRSGAVRAYFGGYDGIGFDFAQAPLQTGSAFKVFAAIAAQQQSIPLSRVLDSSPVTDRGTRITNVDGESCGKCTMAEALKRSLNTSFYRLTMTMFDGPQAIADAAHAAGIPEELPGVAGKTLSEDGGKPLNGIVLGQYVVRPIDMASAYATLGAAGVHHQPYFVQRVVTGDGRVLLDRGGDPDQQVGEQLPEGKQRIPRKIAENTTEAMLPIAAYSNGHALKNNRPSAAKTGTTQLGESDSNKDAWMIGFTPSLSTAVWIGTERSQPIRTARGADIYGSGLPADIWKQVMDDALDGTPIEQFSGTQAPAGPNQSKPPSGGPYDILNPPQRSPQREPAVVIPPSAQPPREVEIFPGLSIPVPG
ncbi:transglycosylase domain-containing protein [Nocardia gipuzkoensis]|uniref:transglycosylase domain-containing protein n=1 Tax=Nocardia gipuzkoensis TaxID=2749991 RepID=UPI00237E9100|nr:transglycosylase domain-containing protein [Nocardia gipuzkoensis]MDE1668524.1 transglycosylase domain-containing protein [Nocardia gipuzkoensis]